VVHLFVSAAAGRATDQSKGGQTECPLIHFHAVLLGAVVDVCLWNYDELFLSAHRMGMDATVGNASPADNNILGLGKDRAGFSPRTKVTQTGGNGENGGKTVGFESDFANRFISVSC